jgi:hypothetical protein
MKRIGMTAFMLCLAMWLAAVASAAVAEKPGVERIGGAAGLEGTAATILSTQAGGQSRSTSGSSGLGTLLALILGARFLRGLFSKSGGDQKTRPPQPGPKRSMPKRTAYPAPAQTIRADDRPSADGAGALDADERKEQAEQLEVLWKAGLLTREEYAERKQELSGGPSR